MNNLRRKSKPRKVMNMGMKKEITVGHGLAFEEPQQTYVILNGKRGFIFYSPIFAD